MDFNNLKYIPEWYAGFQNRDSDSTLLSFLTPNGDNEAANKRKATVDKWRNTKIPASVISSQSLVGYKIAGIANRYGSYGNSLDKWRIIDPRGFEFEVTSEVILYLMSKSDIQGMEVQEPCTIVRRNQSLVLLITDSDEFREIYNSYLQEVEESKNPQLKKKLSDLEIGEQYLDKNNNKFVFLGGFHSITSVNESYSYNTSIHTFQLPRYSKSPKYLIGYLNENNTVFHLTVETTQNIKKTLGKMNILPEWVNFQKIKSACDSKTICLVDIGENPVISINFEKISSITKSGTYFGKNSSGQYIVLNNYSRNTVYKIISDIDFENLKPGMKIPTNKVSYHLTNSVLSSLELYRMNFETSFKLQNVDQHLKEKW